MIRRFMDVLGQESVRIVQPGSRSVRQVRGVSLGSRPVKVCCACVVVEICGGRTNVPAKPVLAAGFAQITCFAQGFERFSDGMSGLTNFANQVGSHELSE